MDENKNVFRDFKTNVILTVPPQIFMIETIKPVDILIYELVIAMSYKKGYCWATTETIMNSLHIGSNATVINSIKKLERLNFVRTEKKVSNGTIRRVIYPINQVYESIVNENRQKISKEKNNDALWEVIENYNWLEDEN